MKLRRFVDGQAKPIGWSHYCPGCKQIHVFNVEQPTRPLPQFNIAGGVRWTFNGNVELPTFSPSMHIQSHPGPKSGKPVRTLCHYHLQNGVLSYCADSPHALKGKSVPLPEIPE